MFQLFSCSYSIQWQRFDATSERSVEVTDEVSHSCPFRKFFYILILHCSQDSSRSESDEDSKSDGKSHDKKLDTPLAAMLPSKYANVDVRELFPDFRPDKVLRFSRLFGPGKPSSLPQIWRSVRKRRHRRKQSRDGTVRVIVLSIVSMNVCHFTIKISASRWFRFNKRIRWKNRETIQRFQLGVRSWTN